MMQQQIEWPSGSRVRCIDPDGHSNLHLGKEYTVQRCDSSARWVEIVGLKDGFYAIRFKPVVRVKMGRKPDLATLVRECAAALAAMTPEQREAVFKKQSASWARQDMD